MTKGGVESELAHEINDENSQSAFREDSERGSEGIGKSDHCWARIFFLSKFFDGQSSRSGLESHQTGISSSIFTNLMGSSPV